MNEAKKNFLKNYVKTTKTSEDKDIERAFTYLSQFFEELPERSKGPDRRKTWTMLTNEIINAFEKLIEKIANCPFIKIEIDGIPDLKEILMTLKTYADLDFIRREPKVKVEEEKRYGDIG